MMMNGAWNCLERVLDETGELVARAAVAPLVLDTPCQGWDLGALLGHMIGQNNGFATAVRDGDAPRDAYAVPVLTSAAVSATWATSATSLRDAFRAAPAGRSVRLRELGPLDVSVERALEMQVLDGAVHAWDVATTLGEAYRPDEATVDLVLGSARAIAARPGGTPGVFAPAREPHGRDPWAEALALLGRERPTRP